jgi:hypothetical protein
LAAVAFTSLFAVASWADRYNHRNSSPWYVNHDLERRLMGTAFFVGAAGVRRKWQSWDSRVCLFDSGLHVDSETPFPNIAWLWRQLLVAAGEWIGVSFYSTGSGIGVGGTLWF